MRWEGKLRLHKHRVTQLREQLSRRWLVRLGVSAPCSTRPLHSETSKSGLRTAGSSGQPGCRTVPPAWGHPAAAPVPAASWTRPGMEAGQVRWDPNAKEDVSGGVQASFEGVHASALLAKPELVLL